MTTRGARMADAPAIRNATPNGLYAEEACQIIRYAGLSDRVRSIGFYEMNPEHDVRDQTSQLVAQMIWYFVNGYYQRKQDDPRENEKDFTKFTVSMKNEEDLVFMKSRKSDRWWVQVPYIDKQIEGNWMVPCSYADYEMACNDEIPDRWIRAFQRLS